MTKWEYKTVRGCQALSLSELNEDGQLGWELVSVVDRGGYGLTAYLKRKLE